MTYEGIEFVIRAGLGRNEWVVTIHFPDASEPLARSYRLHFRNASGECPLSPGSRSQPAGGINQSVISAPTAIMESTAFATGSAGQGMTLTEGEGGGGPG